MSSFDGLSLEGVKVGDPIEVRYYNSRGRNDSDTAIVEKVGRSLVTVTIYGRPVRFAIEDGVERRPATAGGSGFRALTAAEWAVGDRRLDALRKIREVERLFQRLPVEMLEAIVALAEAAS